MSTYNYIYHHLLRGDKYFRTLTNIEFKLEKIGLKGKIERLLPFSNPNEIVTKLITKHEQNKTIVILGDDSLFLKVCHIIISTKIEHNKINTISYIPMFKETNLTKNLGLSYKEQAIEVLAGRIIKFIDVGKISNKYFLNKIQIENKSTVFTINNKYTITPPRNTVYTSINNLRDISLTKKKQHTTNPCDGILNLYFIVKRKTFFSRQSLSINSVIPCRSIKINSLDDDEIEIKIDSVHKLKSPLTVEILPGILPLIVGKKRNFN